MPAFRVPIVIVGGGLLALVAGQQALGQTPSGLLLGVQASGDTSLFTTNTGGTLTSTATVSGGGSSGGITALIRGDQAFTYVTYNTNDQVKVINNATQTVVQTNRVMKGRAR